MRIARSEFVGLWRSYLDDLDGALMEAGRENLVVLALPPQRYLLDAVGEGKVALVIAHALLIRAVREVRRCVVEAGVPDPSLFGLRATTAGGGSRLTPLPESEQRLREVLARCPGAET